MEKTREDLPESFLYKAGYWYDVWRRCCDSGLSKSEFCRRQNVSDRTLRSWRRRLDKMVEEHGVDLDQLPKPPLDPEHEIVEGFTAVEVVGAVHRPKAASGDCFEIACPSGLSLRVPSDIAGERLVEVIRALQVTQQC